MRSYHQPLLHTEIFMMSLCIQTYSLCLNKVLRNYLTFYLAGKIAKNKFKKSHNTPCLLRDPELNEKLKTNTF